MRTSNDEVSRFIFYLNKNSYYLELEVSLETCKMRLCQGSFHILLAPLLFLKGLVHFTLCLLKRGLERVDEHLNLVASLTLIFHFRFNFSGLRNKLIGYITSNKFPTQNFLGIDKTCSIQSVSSGNQLGDL